MQPWPGARWLCAIALVATIADPVPVSSQPAGAPASAALLPAADYAQPPPVSGASLSPDGTRIVAALNQAGVPRIGIWTLAAGPDQQPALIEARGVESFRWAGDQKLLITTLTFAIHTRRRAIYFGPSRQVVSLDLRTNKITQMGSDEGMFEEIIFLDPDARYALLSVQESVETTPSVKRVDLETGAETLVEPALRGVWSWHADARGIVRVGVDYGERRTQLHYRDTAGAPLRRIIPRRNLADGSVVDQVHFVTNSSRGLIVANAGTGRFALYEYDFANDIQGATLFEHPEVDVDDAILGPDGALEGVRFETDRPQVHWFNQETLRLQAQIDRTFAGKTNQIVNRSRDGNRILIWSGGANDPGTYYVFDRAARRMETFATPYERLHGKQHAEVRPVRYRSRDGQTINGYLTLPRDRGERGLPLIVLPHGGPFVRDHWVFDPEVQFLASRGYAVLQPNFRGSTGYGRDFVSRGFGQLGAGMIDDVEDGIDWLVQEGIADHGRVCIMGSSYGGYAAIWAATRSPARYRCAISWAGPSDLRAMLRHTARGFSARRYFRAFQKQIEGETGVDLRSISPARQAARLRVPALIAHGRNDAIVPVDQSEQLLLELKKARTPDIESFIYPKSGHNFEETTEREDYLGRVEAFLTRHNPAVVVQP